MRNNDIFVIIPAYNPGEIIKQVIFKTKEYIRNIIIINDGCDALNKTFLEELSQFTNITLLSHATNQGKGFAIHTGIEYALKQGAKIIIMLDSDGQHLPEELPNFITFAKNNKFDLVIGVRTDINKMPLRSKIGNISMAKIFTLLFGQKLTDTQSGYRMMSAEFAKNILKHVPAGRYETEMRMLMFAAKSNIKIDEIPIKTQYFNANSNSKFRPVIDSLRVLGSFAKYTGVAFLSFLIDYSIYIILIHVFSVHFLSAHIFSRIVSGVFNFIVNKKFVFESDSSIFISIMKYLLAVVFSLLISTLLLYFLVDIVAFNNSLAKILAETSTFIFNYYILKYFVFKKK